MSTPMMQPGMWNTGVQQPNYATPLLDFSPMGKVSDAITGQLKAGQQKPAGNGPMQLAPGPNQGNPVQQGGQPGGPMASNSPFAAALMKLFGGGMQGQPGGFNMGNTGGTNGIFGGSQNAIF